MKHDCRRNFRLIDAPKTCNACERAELLREFVTGIGLLATLAALMALADLLRG